VKVEVEEPEGRKKKRNRIWQEGVIIDQLGYNI